MHLYKVSALSKKPLDLFFVTQSCHEMQVVSKFSLSFNMSFYITRVMNR